MRRGAVDVGVSRPENRRVIKTAPNKQKGSSACASVYKWPQLRFIQEARPRASKSHYVRAQTRTPVPTPARLSNSRDDPRALQHLQSPRWTCRTRTKPSLPPQESDPQGSGYALSKASPFCAVWRRASARTATGTWHRTHAARPQRRLQAASRNGVWARLRPTRAGSCRHPLAPRCGRRSRLR